MVGSHSASPERRRPATVEPNASPQLHNGLTTSRTVVSEKSFSDADLAPADTAGWAKGAFTPRTLEACKREGILPQDLQCVGVGVLGLYEHVLGGKLATSVPYGARLHVFEPMYCLLQVLEA